MLGPTGCDRGTASTAPSDVHRSDAGSGDSENQLQHSDVARADEDSDATEDPADESEKPGEKAADDALSIEAAMEIVSAALDEAIDPMAARIVTPALPASWPLEGSTVVYFVYPLMPAARGVDRYEVTTPSHRVDLDVAAREAVVRTIDKPKKLSAYDRPRPGRDDPIAKAEQALLDLAAGRVKAEKVHYLLFGYGQWFEANGSIGSDAQKRTGAFASWASSWGR
jgi:hypothetical protein